MTKYGEGSLFQRRSDGKWIGRLPDGRGGYRHVTGTDQDEVRRRLRDLRKEQARTTSPSRRGGERVGEYLQRWLDTVAAMRLRPRTIRGHRQVVRNHLMPALARYRLADLAPADVQKLANSLSRDHAPGTVANIVRVLSSALQHALREELVDRNVARLAVLPRRASEPLPSLSTQDVRRFLDATRGHPHWPIWALAFTTGMRRGEVLSLRWADCTDDTVTVSGTYRYAGIVNGKALWKREEPKTPQSRRTLYLTPLGRTARRTGHAGRALVRAPPGAHVAMRDDPVSGLPPGLASNFDGTFSSDLMHADMTMLMEVLGISTHARPVSPHEVMVNEVIPAVERLREALITLHGAAVTVGNAYRLRRVMEWHQNCDADCYVNVALGVTE